MLTALGYSVCDAANQGLVRYRIIINTAPTPLLTEEHIKFCRPDCLKIDLASEKGIAGEDVLWERGLPARDVPETSGILIAQTVLRLLD